jgi:hypothetical protein
MPTTTPVSASANGSVIVTSAHDHAAGALLFVIAAAVITAQELVVLLLQVVLLVVVVLLLALLVVLAVLTPLPHGLWVWISAKLMVLTLPLPPSLSLPLSPLMTLPAPTAPALSATSTCPVTPPPPFICPCLLPPRLSALLVSFFCVSLPLEGSF